MSAATTTVTGYQLRESLKRWALQRDTASAQWLGTLHRFEGEEKLSPLEVMSQLTMAEKAIAQLQTAQAQYNLLVEVEVQGVPMTLSEAIKSVGGVARAEKLWRSAAAPKQDRYGGFRESTERNKDVLVAQPTVRPAEAQKYAAALAKKAGALRQAIALGNARAITISLDVSLLE